MKVPEGFKAVPMGELVERVAKAVDVQEDIAYQQIGIRSHGKGLFDKEPVLGKELGNKRVFWVESDCFIVNIVFAWEQAFGRTTEKDKGKIASHRFPMYRPKNERCDVDFLMYLFKTKYGKHILTLASPGGAGRNKTLGQAEFLKSEIVVPPAKEQKKIAEILSTWDRAIETVEKLIANSQAQKKALMQQLLTGKKRLPGFNGKWEDHYLVDIADVIVSPVDKKSAEGEFSVSLCNYTDVYYNTYITRDLDFMKATAKQSEISRYSLKRDDVIITKDSETPGDIAVPALVNDDLENVVCGYHLAIVRPKRDRSDGAFLNYLFSTPITRYYFFTLATGATRFGLSVGGIQKAHFTLPPIKEQKAIASVFFVSEEEIKLLMLQLERLKKEKSALMQQLLTGKRRVKIEEAKSA